MKGGIRAACGQGTSFAKGGPRLPLGRKDTSWIVKVSVQLCQIIFLSHARKQVKQLERRYIPGLQEDEYW